MVTTIGRELGRACLRVVGNSDRRTLKALVGTTTAPGAVVNIEEWRAYRQVPESCRGQVMVDQGARDDDDDGVGEVYTNTMQGKKTGLRNFLRPFRGAGQ